MFKKIYKWEVLISSEQSNSKICMKLKTNTMQEKIILSLIVNSDDVQHIDKIIPKSHQKISKIIMTTSHVKCAERKNISETDAATGLIDAANYFIQLYYKTGEKYSCSITKLGKLLSIAAFICAKNGVKLFEDDIVIYNCGTGFAKLGYHYLSDVIVQGQTDIETSISRNDICNSVEYPHIYVCEKDLPFNIQNLLLDVFLAYGAYPAKSLGKLIDVFKDKFSTTSSTIDLNRIHSHFEAIVATNTNSTSSEIAFCNYIKDYLWD